MARDRSEYMIPTSPTNACKSRFTCWICLSLKTPTRTNLQPDSSTFWLAPELTGPRIVPSHALSKHPCPVCSTSRISSPTRIFASSSRRLSCRFTRLWQTGYRGGGGARMLVQFAKHNYENSAWVLTKLVPQRYVDGIWQRAEPDEMPD